MSEPQKCRRLLTFAKVQSYVLKIHSALYLIENNYAFASFYNEILNVIQFNQLDA